MDANLIEHEVRLGSCALGRNPASNSEGGEGLVGREVQGAAPRPHEPNFVYSRLQLARPYIETRN